MKRTILPLVLVLVAAAPLALGAGLLDGPASADPAPTWLAGEAAEAELAAAPATTAGQVPALDPVSEGFELVGHNALNNRGMNAALAVHGDYAYVGSRTDGKPTDQNALGAGILVVDISDPANPTVVHEIGPPHQGIEGQTSREMRVWPEAGLLIVQNLGSNCSELIHACSVRKVDDNFTFYDISGDKAAAPEYLATYESSRNPHEFYLWVDPADPTRALLWISATSSNGFIITDVSGARNGVFEELVVWDIPAPGGDLHSMTPTVDGRETHFAYLTGGHYVVDTSEVVDGVADPTVSLITTIPGHEEWPGPGAHSALAIPGNEDVALVTDEVYGDALKALGDHGCPWGWTRFLDVSDPTDPVVLSEYKLPVNEEEFCATDAPRPSSSYSAHNPTVTDEVAFISWHAGGLRAVRFDDPTAPQETGAFIPEALPYVLQEDPALTAGQDKVAFWSFPIIQDGLIYVVDVRNGLYVLEYTGEGAAGVAAVDFLEGNSNVGDAVRLSGSG